MNDLIKLVFLMTSTLLSTYAFAQSSYVGPLNAGLGNGASVSCGACHTSGGQSGGNATLPMASTWRSGANLALSDSDGDGFTNAEEVNGGATNFNIPGITPFVLASGGKSLANVYVVGDAQALEAAAPSGMAITADSFVLGGTAVNVTADPTITAPITLIFKAGGATASSTIYAVNDAANSYLPFYSSDWVLNSNGSVTIKQWPTGASAGAYDILIVSKVTAVPAPGPTRGGEEENEGLEGCVTAQWPTAMFFLFGLLGVTLLTGRKQHN